MTTLRIFRGDSLPQTVQDNFTHRPPYPNAGRAITEIWETEIHPALQIRIKAGKVPRDRLSQYATAIKRWIEFWASRAPACYAGAQNPGHADYPDPPAEQVWGRDLRAWMDWNIISHGVTERTAQKHLNCVKAMWRSAFEGMLPFPKVRSEAHHAKSHKVELSPDAIAQLYGSCEVATWPGHPAGAPAFWRAALVLWLHYGFRTQELVRYQTRHISLSWNDVIESPRFPGTGVPHRNRFGWIRYVPKKQSGKKPDPLIMPITETVAAHLQAIRPTEASGLVFPAPCCHRDLREQWYAIVDAAGLAHYEGVDKLLIKHLRTTCGEWHCAINDEMGPVVLGHAARMVTHQSYVRRVRSLLDNFRKFPVPEVMRKTVDTEQLKLF